MKLLVIGRGGQLASHLRDLRPEALFWGREQLNLEEGSEVESRVIEAAPNLIINAAAYTAVDRAESDPASVWRINCEGPASLARAATILNIPFLHISTDYVFDGQATRPYEPRDPVRPLSVYGRSKLGGELAVATLCSRHWTLRASWVFSEYGSNFVRTMLRLAREREVLSVVADQDGRPTYAGDLARLTLALADVLLAERAAPPPGIYHVGGGPATTWHGFAERIIRQAHSLGLVPRMPEIRAIPTTDYPTPAVRPLHAVLAPSDEFQAALGVVPDWERQLEQVLRRLR